MKAKIHVKKMELSSVSFHCPECGAVISKSSFKKNERLKCKKCGEEFRVTESPEQWFLDLLDKEVGEVSRIPPLERKIEGVTR